MLGLLDAASCTPRNMQSPAVSQAGTAQALSERIKQVSPVPRFIPWSAASAPCKLVSRRGIHSSNHLPLLKGLVALRERGSGRCSDIWAWAQFTLAFGLFPTGLPSGEMCPGIFGLGM